MSENNAVEPITAPTSLLDEDLSAVDTSMPVIRGPVTIELEIVDVTEEESKDKTGMNLVIKVKTVTPVNSTKGDIISPGFPMKKWIGLTPMVGRPGKKDYDGEMIKKSLAQFQEAVEGKKSSIKPLERFKGQRVMAKIGVQEATEKYPNESNSIQFVKRG